MKGVREGRVSIYLTFIIVFNFLLVRLRLRQQLLCPPDKSSLLFLMFTRSFCDLVQHMLIGPDSLFSMVNVLVRGVCKNHMETSFVIGTEAGFNEESASERECSVEFSSFEYAPCLYEEALVNTSGVTQLGFRCHRERCE